MMEDTRPPEIDDEDLASADDAVIGRAFKRSVVALGAVAVIVALGLFLTRRPREAAPESVIETAAPVAVQQQAAPPEVQFTDITRQAGIEFVHFNGAAGEKLLPETMGSGAAFFDYDNDDDPDLLLVNSTFWPHSATVTPAPTSALYRNDGSGNFEDVTRQTGFDVSLYGTGVAVGDYDADGRRDVFLTAVGENRLLRNLGDRFEDVTARAGVAGDPQGWSSSAGFFDGDNDGDLDLFVCNYVRWSKEIDFEVDFRLLGVGRAYGPPFNYEGTYSYLYRNEGDGTFTDISAAAGIQVRNPATGVAVGKALGLLPIDLDADGWLDIFIANDTVRNFLFHNRGDGTFEEVGELWGLAYGRSGEATGAMGADAGAYRNDSAVGIAIGNFANEMTSLYLSQGDPTLYADEAIVEGIGAPSRQMLSFGVLFFDYDLDGRLDLLQANGHLEQDINRVDPSQTYAQPAQLFWNAGPDQRQTFIPVPVERSGGLTTPLAGRGSSVADIDGDGDQDVVLTQTGRPPLLLRNDQDLGHHWLRLKLQDDGPNPDAIGAWLELTAGGVTQRRQVMPTRSYQSQSATEVTFGLGESAQVEALEITWPAGSRQQVTDLAVDQFRRIRKEG
jgi:hypothetical protein